MADISKWLPPPVPVSSKLPIFKKSALNQPQPTTTLVSVKIQLSPPATAPVSGKLHLDPFTTPLPQKPIITQPVPLAIPSLTSTQYSWQAQTVSSTITPDVKPKHPQQVLIDNIASAIPKSAIFSTVTHPLAAPLTHPTPTVAQPLTATNTLTLPTFATIDQKQNLTPNVQPTA